MGKKRKVKTDPVQDMYRDVTRITARESTGRPGTPHSYFSTSHEVQVNEDSDDTQGEVVMVHGHANGLCIVALRSVPENLESVEYLVTPAPDGNGAERRKRQAALLKSRGASDLPGAVTPTTILANLRLKDGTIRTVPSGVWGIVVELNACMSAEVLLSQAGDPLLEGYIAIIQPATGAYPPRTLELAGDGAVTKKMKTTPESADDPSID